jgi:RNA polymerase sigma factor (sigma-70 family)
LGWTKANSKPLGDAALILSKNHCPFSGFEALIGDGAGHMRRDDMERGRISALLHHVQRLLASPDRPESDAYLVDRVVEQRDDQAFAALLGRHGPMVWSLCRRLTNQEQDAEDVFQATFLLLARKAAAIRNCASVGSWLFGVARRLAIRTRSDAALRRKIEKQQHSPRVHGPCNDPTLSELRAVLDEELARLPDKLRAPLLLCYFEECTHEEAAKQLGWSKRLVKFRLESGRKRLRSRLSVRGLTLSSVLIGSILTTRASSGAVPVLLAAATLRVAMPFASGNTVAGGISPRAIALAEGGLNTMIHTKTWSVAVAMLAVATVLGGAGVLLRAKDDGPKPPTTLVEKPLVDLFGDPLPRGAIARLGTVRFRKALKNGVSGGVSFMPDGRTIAVADGGNAVLLWDRATGKILREITTPLTAIDGFALSADGKYFAVCGYLSKTAIFPERRTASIWEISTGERVKTFARDSDDIGRYGSSLAFSKDGKLLISFAAPSGILRIEEIESGKEIVHRKFPQDPQICGCLAVSPDGATVAVHSGPSSNKLWVWKWQTEEQPRELNVPSERKGRRYSGSALTFSPDGNRLAECGDNEGTVRIWDIPTAKLVHKITPKESDPALNYRHAAFAPDGKSLVACGYGSAGGVVDQWDSGNWKLQNHLDSQLGNLAFSPDGKLLAVTGGSGLQVWNLESAKEVAATEEAHHGTIEYLAAAGKRVITASGDLTIRVWDPATGKQQARLKPDGRFFNLAASPDGTRLVCSTLNDAISLWDLESGRTIFTLPGHGKSGGHAPIRFLADGRHFLSYGYDFFVRKWDVATGKLVREFRLEPNGVKIPGEDATSYERDNFYLEGHSQFSPDGKLFVVAFGKDFHVFDVATGQDLRQFPREATFSMDLAISPDGKTLAASSWDQPNNAMMAAGQTAPAPKEANFVYFWNLATGKVIKKIPVSESGIYPVAFSPDGKYFAFSTDLPEPRIHVWNLVEDNKIGVIHGFRQRVCSLAFTQEGKRLISGMDDTTGLVWDLAKVWDSPK